MTAHDLLLALAGRVDDDLLAWARELVAVGDDDRGIELVTAALVADRVVLPADVRTALVTAARAARSVLDADAGLPAAGAGTTSPHVFTASDASSAARVAAVLRELLGTTDCRAWLASRRTPAGSASGPLPHPVVLVELDAAQSADVLAHQLGAALRRAGVSGSVEAYAKGAELPEYHVAARAAGVALDLGADVEIAAAAPQAPAPAAAAATPDAAAPPVSTQAPTVEPVAEVEPPTEALVADAGPPNLARAARPDTPEDTWAWLERLAVTRRGPRTSDAEPSLPAVAAAGARSGVESTGDAGGEAAADLPAGPAERLVEPAHAAQEPRAGRARLDAPRREPGRTEDGRSRPVPLGGRRLFSAEPEPEPADDTVVGDAAAAAAGPAAEGLHQVESSRVDLPRRAPRLAALRDGRPADGPGGHTEQVDAEPDAESSEPAEVISAWWATPEPARDPGPSEPVDLWTPVTPSEPATPDEPHAEHLAAPTGGSARPRPHPRAVPPAHDPVGDPLSDPLSGPLLSPLLDPTFGDEPDGPGPVDRGAVRPQPRARLVPTADPQPGIGGPSGAPRPGADRPRPAPADGPFGAAPRPAAAEASPRPAHTRGIPRLEAADEAPSPADTVAPGQGAAPADDIPGPPRASRPAPVAEPQARPRHPAPAPLPQRPSRPAPADDTPPRPPRPAPAADTPATPRPAPAADSPAPARPAAGLTARPRPLPPMGTNGATATGGARILPPVAGPPPGEVVGGADPLVAPRRPGGRRRLPDGAHLAPAPDADADAAPDAEPTTQALPEQPPAGGAEHAWPGRRHQGGPVPAEARTPVHGEPVVVDPRLGLRPESLERLSSTDRALLARLQSELGMRTTASPTPAPRPRPVRSDPPDIAG